MGIVRITIMLQFPGNCKNHNYVTIPMVIVTILMVIVTIPMEIVRIIILSIGLCLLYSTVGFNLCLRNKKSMPNGLPEIGLT